jgi:protein involved in polysaccharide export with SLBB domain
MRLRKVSCLVLALSFLFSGLAQGQRKYFKQKFPAEEGLDIEDSGGQGAYYLNQGPSTGSDSSPSSMPRQGAGATFPITPLETFIDPASYVLDVGDLLTLYIWGKTNEESKLYVASDGKLYLQKGGYIEARGKTIARVEAEVRAITQRFYIGVNVSLSLAKPRTFLIKVVGEVKVPGIYPAKPIDRVNEILYSAGGITKIGSQKFVKLLRDGEEIEVDLEQFNASAKEGTNPFVKENDIIVVPLTGNRVEILGEVRKPAVFEIREKAKLAEIVTRAGGFTETASLTKPIIVSRLHRDRSEREIISMERKPIVMGELASDFELLPNDIVSVPSTGAWQKTVVVKGAIVGGLAKGVPTESQILSGAPGEEREGIYPLAGGDKVSDIIKLAGGVTPYADLKAAFIARKDLASSNGTLETISIDLYKMYIEKDFSGDVELKAGDILTIPSRKFRVFVTGEVKNPTSFDYRSQLTVMEYVSMAGGPTNRADLDDISIVRADGREFDWDEVDALAPGDTIFVSEKLFKFWQDHVTISTAITGLLTSILFLFGAIN